jgi:hypothetical protein
MDTQHPSETPDTLVIELLAHVIGMKLLAMRQLIMNSGMIQDNELPAEINRHTDFVVDSIQKTRKPNSLQQIELLQSVVKDWEKDFIFFCENRTISSDKKVLMFEAFHKILECINNFACRFEAKNLKRPLSPQAGEQQWGRSRLSQSDEMDMSSRFMTSLFLK